MAPGWQHRGRALTSNSAFSASSSTTRSLYVLEEESASRPSHAAQIQSILRRLDNSMAPGIALGFEFKGAE
eukprot:scaffold731_cov261-Pinguiococcus_pyrenoidosus.AAC.41